MADRRRRNVQWYVANEQGEIRSSMRDDVMLAVLMDIRAELQLFNANISTCRKFLQMPNDLKAIRRNTTKKKRP